MSLLEQLQQYGAPEEGSAFVHVVRHPLGDDGALLQRLDMQPEDCTTCDLYWLSDDRLMFVSLLADSTRTPLVTAHRREDGELSASFFVVTGDAWLTHAHVERALSALSTWISNNGDAMAALNEQPVVVAEDDVAVDRRPQ